MPTLGVNIDHVATVRQARRTDEPDPVWAAAEAQLGGASCITFHLREDRRHMTDRDVPLLKDVVVTKLNMEMSIAPAQLWNFGWLESGGAIPLRRFNRPMAFATQSE